MRARKVAAAPRLGCGGSAWMARMRGASSSSGVLKSGSTQPKNPRERMASKSLRMVNRP